MFRSYLLTWLLLFLVLLGAAAGINFWVDPYDILGRPRTEGFNAVKPTIGTKVRTSKIHQVMNIRPRAVVIGNSRPEMGLNPEHPCWPADARPVFMMAVPGFGPYRQLRYGQHALAAGDVRIALVGLDFMDYLMSPSEAARALNWPDPDVEPLGLKVTARGEPRAEFSWDHFVGVMNATVSLDALADSLWTVVRQDNPGATTRTALGFNPAGGAYGAIIRREGQQVLFQQKNREMARRMAGSLWSLYQDDTDSSSPLEALRQFIRYAQSRNVRLVLFINPYHADYLTMIHQAGLWPLFEEWKRRVTLLAEAEGAVPLWDFSDYDSYSTETLHSAAQRGKSLSWFWEPAHYRQELGDKMLDRMLSDSCPAGTAEGDYGASLKPETLAAHLKAIAARRDRYLETHATEVAEMSHLVATVRGKPIY